jgi:hypothetical protein
MTSSKESAGHLLIPSYFYATAQAPYWIKMEILAYIENSTMRGAFRPVFGLFSDMRQLLLSRVMWDGSWGG